MLNNTGINVLYNLYNKLFHLFPQLGIVGRTGAGKSTVFNVLLRFYHYMGIVTIDDVNIRRIGLQDLRNHITFLLQVCVCVACRASCSQL